MTAGSPRSTCHRVLFLGKPGSDLREQLLELLSRHGFALADLTETAPATGEALNPVLASSEFAVLDLDTGPSALAWLGLLRRQRPEMPLVAAFEYCDLAALLTTAPHGLDGALVLPVSPEQLDAFFAPFIGRFKTAAVMTATNSLSTAAPFAAPETLLKAAHLSPASSANQKILGTIDARPKAARFIAHGPAGSEFTLLALEIASRRGWREADIHFGPGAPPASARLVVVRSLELPAACATHQTILHCHAGETLAAQDDGAVVLSLLPLGQRLSDVAHYTARWLPVLATACLQPAPPLPLPDDVRNILLTHSWPGQFSELWRTLEQIALTAGSGSVPENLRAAGASASFDEFVQRTAARAFREKIALRVPPALLPTVLSALGCPAAAHD
jgi:hypothetical protein